MSVSDSSLKSEMEFSKTKEQKVKPLYKERKAAKVSIDDDKYIKDLTMTVFERQGWNKEELELLNTYLSDPRAVFKKEILIRNSTFVETEAQYAHYLTSQSVDRCIEFWESNKTLMSPITEEAGVPPEYILAILKVETNFGDFIGKESVFNVYWSLSLGDMFEIQKSINTPEDVSRVEMVRKMTRRALWARSQLRDLLFMAKNGGQDPLDMLGSYAGAFGLSQFIPSSYRAFGRDGNNDKIIDLNNVADATASIAYYLNENGWPKISNRERQRKVILTYNKSKYYADCVMALADSIVARWNN